MGRLLEMVAPARMGAGFRWLLASVWIGNVGDGIALSAGPLLVASQTHTPILVVGEVFADTAAPTLLPMIVAPAFGWLERQLALSTVMRGCLLLEVLTHLGLALTTVGWVAALIMVLFGGYAFVWGILSQVVRQRATPTEFQGRVGSVYLLAVFAGIVVGQGIGGPLAQQWGLTAPFWFASVGSAVTLVLVWRQLGHLADAYPP